MASAAPILASTLGSLAVAKIGESQGWDPMLTGVLSAGVGLGAGGLTSAAFNPVVGSAAGSTAMSVNPHAGFGIVDIAPTKFPFAMSATPHRGMGVLNRPKGIMPTPTGGPIGDRYFNTDGPIGFDLGDGQAIGKIGKPANQFLPPERSGAPTYMGNLKGAQYMSAVKDEFKGMFSEGGSGQNFLKSMGAQLVDSALAEPAPLQGGGGGGGGGGGSAQAYQGGGSGGQYQVVGGFPGRAAGPQWKEIA